MSKPVGSNKDRRILIIDDDQDLLNLLARVFTQQSMTVKTASNGQEGLRQLYTFRPHLVILDIMMPGMDGWQTLQNIRQFTDVPVIILSALSEDKDIVRGLRLGAHDFVSKPFGVQVLQARAERLLRQQPALLADPATHKAFDDGHLTIDVETRQVTRDGKVVKLSVIEYGLLAYLAGHAGQTLSHGQILTAVWGWDAVDHPEYLHTYVSRLRHKLEKDPAAPQYILTERGVGYRFLGKDG